MNPKIQLKGVTSPTRVALACIYFALSQLAPNTFGVVPPPDGGYPNFTTAEGQNALFSLTTGAANTAVGWRSLFSDTEGSFNTATGAGTLLLNTSSQNTAFGAAALLFNTTGLGNTAVGAAALLHNTIADGNTATGAFALSSNTTGPSNTATGRGALQYNTEGQANTATGESALFFNTTGQANTATGESALFFNTTGYANTATGSLALFTNNGIQNTANGQGALSGNSTGNANTAIGNLTLHNNTAGSDNIALGILAGDNVTTASEVICIGAPGANVSNSCFIGQIYSNVQPVVGTDPDVVTINSNGRLGRANVSSRRYKHDIQPMHTASEAIYALKPVSFRYDKQYDQTQTLAFGLIAEEVADVYPDLVGRNHNGEPESVRYDQVNAMLLNEFLKEHRKNEEQEAIIARLQKQIETLSAGLQKISAQIEISKAVGQTALNNP